MNAIYLTDLALLYFPHSTPRSAVSQLRRWVNLNSELQQRLTELHYQKGQRALTPLQHAAFVEFLGDGRMIPYTDSNPRHRFSVSGIFSCIIV